VEKATELGVTRIVPVGGGRSERGLFDGAKKRIERWRRIAREASEQSRRVRPPEIDEAVGFAAALNAASSHASGWMSSRALRCWLGLSRLTRGQHFAFDRT